MNLYEIIFEDGSTFLGGTLENPNWLNIPKDKKIRVIFYSLPWGGSLILKNCNEYYHFIEALNDLNGKKAGQIQLEYAYLIGKKNTTYIMYRICLKDKRVDKIILDKPNKMIKELNPIGWR